MVGLLSDWLTDFSLTFYRYANIRRSFPPITCEPTYKLQPDWTEKFNPRIVENILKIEMTKNATITTYNHGLMTQNSLQLLNRVKISIKSLNFRRYVIILHLVLIQNLGQGVQSASRCLWHPENDDKVTNVMKVGDVFVEVTVFGVYKM
ncbi:hypothetical protein HELRODRAFT_86178 [Helobdella robusta]|uniref:Uncharacterized protein n=1 Tax=Helobdella robusta TaxID=6412 RepID=T1G681_HELRO|nr:hypothetical protein HELRODRAFT_86178 [Helobdella robusta]ESN95925.1 hypothetical protein HELRODRAFT_86178 [Helobdella robusta]